MITKSTKFVERLASLKVEILDFYTDLATWMKTHGRVGAGKLVDEGYKTRVLVDDVIEEYIFDLPITYTEKARIVLYDVLELMNIKKFRYTTNKIYTFPPLFAKAGSYDGFWAYVDIKSAYPTIYSRFLNVKYLRGKYMSDAIYTPFTALRDKLSKRVKNSVFGAMRASHIRRYENNGKLTFRWIEIKHGLLNPDLVNCTYDILQAIAYKAIKDYGAVYFNTDGAIIPCNKVNAYISFLNEIGFEAGIKVKGEGALIKACNAYKIGEVETLSYRHVNVLRNFSNIVNEDEANWILNIYRKKVSKVL